MIAGDTVPCVGGRVVHGADMLVHTVMRRDLIEPIGLPRLDWTVLDYHSWVEDAAQTAARDGVGTLVLTHLVPRPQPETEPEWVERAHKHFDGEIVLARDLFSLEVGHDRRATERSIDGARSAGQQRRQQRRALRSRSLRLAPEDRSPARSLSPRARWRLRPA